MKGHFAKNNLPPVRFLQGGSDRESMHRTARKMAPRRRQVLVDIFDDDKFVDMIGTSKGRGFAGVVKRHKFRRRAQVARSHVPDSRLDRLLVVSVARVSKACACRDTWAWTR